MGDYSHRKRKVRSKKREHKRITRRMRPGMTGRRKEKASLRKRVQNATSSVVRHARRGRP